MNLNLRVCKNLLIAVKLKRGNSGQLLIHEKGNYFTGQKNVEKLNIWFLEKSAGKVNFTKSLYLWIDMLCIHQVIAWNALKQSKSVNFQVQLSGTIVVKSPVRKAQIANIFWIIETICLFDSHYHRYYTILRTDQLVSGTLCYESPFSCQVKIVTFSIKFI